MNRTRTRSSRLDRFLLPSGLRQPLLPVALAILTTGLFLVPCAKDPADDLYREFESTRVSGKTEEVGSLAKKFVANYPTDPRTPLVLFELGRINKYILPNPEKAVEYFRRIVYSYPVGEITYSALLELGDLYHRHYQDYERALVHYQRLVDLFPDRPEIDTIRHNISDCYIRQGNFEQARVELETLIRQKPGSPLNAQAYFEIGKSFYLEGNLEKAIFTYREFLKKFPKHELVPEVKFSLASAYEEDGDLDEALRIFSEIESTYQNPKVVSLIQERILKRKTLKR